LLGSQDDRSRCQALCSGDIVFEGTPVSLIAQKSTLTGKHLAAYVRS